MRKALILGVDREGSEFEENRESLGFVGMGKALNSRKIEKALDSYGREGFGFEEDRGGLGSRKTKP